MFSGYLNDPEATAAAYLEGGWYRTGDVVRVDPERYVWVLDRARDMVIAGGENIFPAEVEAVLAEHPDVREAAVIGLPDQRWGEVVLSLIHIFNTDLQRRVAEAYGQETDSLLALRRAIAAFWRLYTERLPEIVGIMQAAMVVPSFAAQWQEIHREGTQLVAQGIRQSQREGWAPGLDPESVSYTHLDVYKRQGRSCRRRPPRESRCWRRRGFPR